MNKLLRLNKAGLTDKVSIKIDHPLSRDFSLVQAAPLLWLVLLNQSKVPYGARYFFQIGLFK
jgi:hypothetical protein